MSKVPSQPFATKRDHPALWEQESYRQPLADPIDKIEHDLIPKTDGFFGGNPANDWIVTQEAQAIILTALETLQEAFVGML